LCDGPHAANAAGALARLRDPRALDTLWHLFAAAPDRAVRHAAGRALAATGGPVRTLWTNDPSVRRAQLWLLARRPEWRADHLLSKALTDPDPVVRARAAQASAGRADPASAERIRPLLDDPDPRVRAATVTGLGQLGGIPARDWLVQRRSDPHPQVRAAVEAALRRLSSVDPAR
jgi:HEAT repeat protein